LLISFGGDQLLITREICFNTTTTKHLSTNILVQIDKWPNEKIPNCVALSKNKNIFIGCQNRSLNEINCKTGQLLRTFDKVKIFGKNLEEEEFGGGIRITKVFLKFCKKFQKIFFKDLCRPFWYFSCNSLF